MKRTLEAKLDRRSQAALERLIRRTGWSQSRVVREAFKLLEAFCEFPPVTRVIGLGQFASGVPDLGSNKRHLRGLGV